MRVWCDHAIGPGCGNKYVQMLHGFSIYQKRYSGNKKPSWCDWVWFEADSGVIGVACGWIFGRPGSHPAQVCSQVPGRTQEGIQGSRED